MARKSRKPAPKKSQQKGRKAPAKKKSSGPRVSRVIEQVKEPLSLLGTLKEEGLANAITFLTMASAVAEGAKKNLRLEAVKPQLKELVSQLGFAFREDVERLEARLEEMEHLLSEREYERLRHGEDE